MMRHRAIRIALATVLSLAAPIVSACDQEDVNDLEEGVNEAEEGVEKGAKEVEEKVDELDSDGKDD